MFTVYQRCLLTARCSLYAKKNAYGTIVYLQGRTKSYILFSSGQCKDVERGNYRQRSRKTAFWILTTSFLLLIVIAGLAFLTYGKLFPLLILFLGIAFPQDVSRHLMHAELPYKPGLSLHKVCTVRSALCAAGLYFKNLY